MAKITGMEDVQNIPHKVLLLYGAVEQLIMEDTDIKDICVSTITDKAGIGKGTAYDYFGSKEEILACAVMYYMRKTTEELRCGLANIESFSDKIGYLIEQIRMDNAKQQYFLRYVHLMTDTSGLGRILQEKMREEKDAKYCPASVYREIILAAREKGEVRKDLPVDYMVFVLFSRMISYMVCIGGESIMDLKEEEIRPYVEKSILDELCEKSV